MRKMELNDELLESYISEKPDIMRNVKNLLDSTDGWKEIVYELQKYRVPVFLNMDILKTTSSPSTYLINELMKRSCSIQDFKELLQRSKLLNALSLLEDPEPVKIVVQPGKNYEKIAVAFGEDLRLECVACGLPPPKYQWYCDNNMLLGCDSSILVVSDFKEELEGEYFCIVSQKTEDYLIEVTSNVVVCSLLESLPEFLKSPPSLLFHKIGSEVKLEVEIFCHSKYKIEWIKENQILEGENQPFLRIKSVEQSDAAFYRCVARNSAGEVFSEPCELIVSSGHKKKNKASAKVALLIANSKYENFSHLKTPTADVLLLADKLENLNFHVITLIDLTLREMHNTIQWFFENVPAKAYAFFCYIGHGFLLLNNKFMMPVDCPKQNEYKMADCIWDELLIKKAKEKKLKLLVTVLDMCLKGPDSNENPDIFNERHPNYSYEPYHRCSIVQAFATSNHQAAYENPNMAHGLYIDHICRYLEDDKLVVHIFQTAHEEFLKNKVGELQTPSLSFDANKHFKFTDPVEEDLDVQNKLLPFTKAKELKYYHELYFPDADLNTTLFVMPHKGRILNAIDMQFSQTVLSQWHPSAWISPGSLTFEWTSSTKDNGCFLTLFNIQKVKTNIYVTPFLNDENHRLITKADSVVDLGLPLIASAKLWLQQE